MTVTTWIRAIVEAGVTGVVIFAMFRIFFPRVLRLVDRQLNDAKEERSQHRREIERLAEGLNYLATATQEQTHEIHELRRDIRDSLSDDIPTPYKSKRTHSSASIPIPPIEPTQDLEKKK